MTPGGLKALNVSKRYPTRAGELEVLRDVSLEVGPGRGIVITGPSGSGKSTLLSIVGTLETPTRGRVEIDGADPFAAGERELAGFRNRKIGFVFQEHHLLPQCSALENVLLPALADRANRPSVERASELLDRVGLSGRSEHRPAELSGGERQRTAVARALMNRPALLLADEPTGSLDRSTADSVADLLCALPRDEQVALVVVTHSAALAERFDERYELVDGVLSRL
jgi:lipoprotein-releasing system ATP-binding protein